MGHFRVDTLGGEPVTARVMSSQQRCNAHGRMTLIYPLSLRSISHTACEPPSHLSRRNFGCTYSAQIYTGPTPNHFA